MSEMTSYLTGLKFTVCEITNYYSHFLDLVLNLPKFITYMTGVIDKHRIYC